MKAKRLICVAAIFSAVLAATAAPSRAKDWTIEVVVLDGIDSQSDAYLPIQEAMRFIHDHSPLLLRADVVDSNAMHAYTYWPCSLGEGKCVTVEFSNIDQRVRQSLLDASSYLFLYRVNGKHPLQAGSTWGPSSSGLVVNGIQKPAASIPVDVRWYKNQPYEGFNSREAQIMTHEIINCISGVLTQPPYDCAPLTSDSASAQASIYEASRLAKLTGSCYRSYEMNGD